MPNQTVSDIDERERKAAAARMRFEQLTLELASQRRFGGPDGTTTEIEIMDEAIRLVDQSREAGQ